jgi:hypothetical protein
MNLTGEDIGAPRLVAIHGAPRSGTSWLGQMFNSSEHVAYRYQPLFSYALRGSIDRNSSAGVIGRFKGALLASEDDFVLQRHQASMAGYTLDFPKGKITHVVYKEVRHHDVIGNLLDKCPDAIGIGIVRHPCAVVHSWWRAPREFDPTWSLAEQWRSASLKNRDDTGNWYGFDRWKDLAEMFNRLESSFPGRFVVVQYEELIADPVAEIHRLYEACGLDVSSQVLAFIGRSRSSDDGSTYGVFRDGTRAAGAWRRDLDPEIVGAILAEIQDTPLERFLASTA